MKIGLLGFGTVGQGVYTLAQSSPYFSVSRVLCRRDLTVPGTQVTHNFSDILRDPTIDTVVEVMGGVHPAYEYVRSALECGKHVVTANKALMAAYYHELVSLAKEKGVSLRCTAAVGGGIGWLTALERVRRVEPVTKIWGILNGTSNYILDSMTRLGLGYAEALKKAQSLGYAEADPSADVDGIDTRNKLILSANIAFGTLLEGCSVPTAGIGSICAGDIQSFAAHGTVCKLIGFADGENAFVQPTLFPGDKLEAAVPENYNLISMESPSLGRQSFYGQGAGRFPTAMNVIQDCMDILEGKGFYCESLSKYPKSQTFSDFHSKNLFKCQSLAPCGATGIDAQVNSHAANAFIHGGARYGMGIYCESLSKYPKSQTFSDFHSKNLFKCQSLAPCGATGIDAQVNSHAANAFIHGDAGYGIGIYCDCGSPAVVTNGKKLRYYVRGASLPPQLVEADWGSGMVTVPIAVSKFHEMMRSCDGVFFAAMECTESEETQ